MSKDNPMSRCDGKKPECKGDSFTGEGIFVCKYYDSQYGVCRA